MTFIWQHPHFYSSQNILESRPEQAKKNDILESLVTDVNEPWINHFLTKTLEMAVNGEKGILTSEQDGGEDDQGDIVCIYFYFPPFFTSYEEQWLWLSNE